MQKSNWIDQVLAECEHVETPRSYLWWSLCCSISAAAGNNYFLRTLKGAVLYKPNLYVMLLGESGLGKGFPVNVAKIMVQKADVTRVIAGRSSIQAIVRELATQRTRPDKPPMIDSRGFIINGELSTAIIQDPQALTILTDLYDGHYNPEWTNLLKGDEPEKLKDPYITCLFGSSPAHFYDSVPQKNIEGGYIGRNLIIYEEKRYKDSDLLDEDDDGVISFPYDKFVPHLEKIATNRARLLPDHEAKVVFNTWRRAWRATQPKDTTGFINRVPDHVLKVAMCLTLAKMDDFDFVIGKPEIIEAIERVTALTYSSKRASEGKSQIDPLAVVTKKVLDLLLTADGNELKRKSILNKMYSQGVADAVIIDKVLDNLMEKDWLIRERYLAGKSTDWLYKLTGEPLEQYKTFVNRKVGNR